MNLYKTNATSTGFIPNSDGSNSIPAIILNGNSYATINEFEQLFPSLSLSDDNASMFTSGFDISITFKVDEAASDTDTILSFGTYSNGTLYSGFDITARYASVKVPGTKLSEGQLIIPKGKICTIDLNVKFEDILTSPDTGEYTRYYYFVLGLDGVLSKCTRIAAATKKKSDTRWTYSNAIDWTWAKKLYLGCRDDNGTLSKFSHCYIYDFKVYDTYQSEFTLIRNYISAYEQANLVNGAINQTIHNTLCAKNLIGSDGKCAIWDESNGNDTYMTGLQLFNTLSSLRADGNLPYDMVLITETESGTSFEDYSRAIWSGSSDEIKSEVMKATFNCKIDFLSSDNKSVTIQQPIGSTLGPKVGLQGTSSLGYNSKNYEIYLGTSDASGTPLLFMPNDNWLPENEFTLKSDVVDSAHVNNVLIGKIINGELDSDLPNLTKSPFDNTPPMSIGQDVYASTADHDIIQPKLRHTSDGFPILLFIKFADKTDGTIGSTKFMGIYNFNLGRAAYHNLGLKVLTSYTKDIADGPSTVTTYTEKPNLYDADTADVKNRGIYSFEVENNDSSPYNKAFGQDDITIVKAMLGNKAKYSSRDPSDSSDTPIAFNKIQELYTQLAGMVKDTFPKYKTTDGGATSVATGEYYQPSTMYSYSEFEKYMHLKNSCAYFVIGIIFGMVDSMCKNMTLRNWGQNVWYPAFYDMDTAFKLNNSANESVEYWAHLHYYYNILGSNGATTSTAENFYPTEKVINGASRTQYYASNWTRLWEVLDPSGLANKDATGSSGKVSIADVYQTIRTNIIPDPDAFIDTYYKGYVNRTGGIFYNYDYKIKYINLSEVKQKIDGVDTIAQTQSYNQNGFLYGTRVETVKEWFKKRILFLDSIYGVNSTTLETPINSIWLQNRAANTGTTGLFGVVLKTTSKMQVSYDYTGASGKVWVDENNTTVMLPRPSGDAPVSIRASHYITQFTNFNSFTWKELSNIDFPQLDELDLSGQASISVDKFFNNGVYEPSGAGLKNIKKLNLSKVVLVGNSSSFTLDCSACAKLEELNISNSSVTNYVLPTSSILKVFNLAGTSVQSLVLSNQSVLETLDISNCNSLTTINITNCPSLKRMDIPSTVTSVTFSNCPGLESVTCTFNGVSTISPLSTITITECPGLKTINLSGQNNTNLVATLSGATNLETLNLARTSIKESNLLLAPQATWTTLKSLDISYTELSRLNYNQATNVDYLDLSNFPDLSYLYANSCRLITKVVCPNTESNPIELPSGAFKNCAALKTVYGHFLLQSTETFRNCTYLTLNNSSKYDGTGGFIAGIDVTNLSFSTTSLYYTFEGCTNLTGDDFKYIILRLSPNTTSLEGAFNYCSGIEIDIWYDIFKNLSKVTTLKSAFVNTKLKGIIRSRLSTYTATDKTTWGTLDFLPLLSDASYAFAGTSLNWIDNNVFAPIDTTYSPITNADYMFSDCSSLYSSTDTTADTIIQGSLSSKTFFTNLRNLSNIFPKGLFKGCYHISMTIDSDANNTYLFHTANSSFANSSYQLTKSLYDGINLNGTLTPNVFGGINRVINDGTNTYYIPVLTQINMPFSGSNGTINMTFANMGNSLQIKNANGQSAILQAIGPFYGCTVSTTDTIPSNIFRNLINLNSIEKFYYGINGLTASDYEFPALDSDGKSEFNDCVKLSDINSLFLNVHNMNIKLVGERFTNCVLENVSKAFYGSGVYGTIPYRLFFMSNGTTIRKTITDMSYVFGQCWKLGYTKDRTIDTTIFLEDESRNTTWNDHIIKEPGTRVLYKLDTSNLTKSYNYDYYVPTASTTTGNPVTTTDTSGNTIVTTTTVSTTAEGVITTTNHIVTTATDGTSTTKDETTTTYNSLFNPGSQAFDVWYLDGFGWENASTSDTSTDNTSLANVKARLTSNYRTYFGDDTAQKEALAAWDVNLQYSEYGFQNYAFPTDLFRYCATSCTLENALTDLAYKVNIVTQNKTTGKYSISNSGTVILDTEYVYSTDLNTKLGTSGAKRITSKYDGIMGRVPAKVFESLTTNPILSKVFQDTRFCAYINLKAPNTTSLTRGLKYSKDLFRYNTALLGIRNMFYNTHTECGVDYDPSMFDYNPSLSDISYAWGNCEFNSDPYYGYSGSTDNSIYSNFKLEDTTSKQILSSNKYIKKAAGLFAFSDVNTTANSGLQRIVASFLSIATNIEDISSMFQGNLNLKGYVPLFDIVTYPNSRNSCSNYLTGVIKDNIKNQSSVTGLLRPTAWGEPT